jgi:hypothetical protein
MMDRYVISFLPYALIVIGRYLNEMIVRNKIITCVGFVAMLLVSAIWTRGRLAESEAVWKGADLAREEGVRTSQIHGSWEWNCYHGAFDEYLTEERGREDDCLLDDFFYRWIPERCRLAEAIVSGSMNDIENDWFEWLSIADIKRGRRRLAEDGEERWREREEIGEIPYKDAFYRSKKMHVFRKLHHVP